MITKKIALVLTWVFTLGVGFPALFTALPTYADTSATLPTTNALPTTLSSLFTQYSSQISSANANNWTYAPPSSSYSGSMYAYYESNPSGPSSPFSEDLAGGTYPVSEWGSTYYDVYSSTYYYVGQLNKSYISYLEELNSITSDNSGSTGDTDLQNAQSSMDSANNIFSTQLVPYMANVYAGLAMLNSMGLSQGSSITSDQHDSNIVTGVFNGFGSGVGSTIKGTLASSYNDLDLNNTQELQKPQSLSNYLSGQSTSAPQDSSDPYNSLEEFYTDLQTLQNVLLNAPSTLTQTSAESLSLSLKGAGQTVDSNLTGNQSPASTQNVERCGSGGNAGILNFINVNYDICVLVDYFSQFTSSLLLSAGQLLAVTASIPQGSSSVSVSNNFNEGGTGTSVSSFWSGALPSDVTTPFQQLMVDQNSDVGKTVASTSGILLKLLDVVLLLLFLFVAVANILQLQVKTYGIRNLIPGLIIGFIVAQAGFFLIRGSLEIVSEASNEMFVLAKSGSSYYQPGNVIQDFVNSIANVRGPNSTVCFTVGSSSGSCASSTDIDMGMVFQQAVLNFFVFAGAILIFILGFQFAIRVVVFTVAVPLAPVAIFSRFFPPLSSMIWGRWSKTVFGWILMPIPALGLLVMASIFFNSPNGIGKDTSLFGYLLDYVVGIFFLYSAIKVPGSMAGEAKMVLDRWNTLGKSAYNGIAKPISNATGVTNFKEKVMPAFKDRIKARDELMKSSGYMNKKVIGYAKAIGENTNLKNEEIKGNVAEAEVTARENMNKYFGKGLKIRRKVQLADGTYTTMVVDHSKGEQWKYAKQRNLRAEARGKKLDAYGPQGDALAEGELIHSDASYRDNRAEADALGEEAGMIQEINKGHLTTAKYEMQMAKQGAEEIGERYFKLRAEKTEEHAQTGRAESFREREYYSDQPDPNNPGQTVPSRYYTKDVQLAEIQSSVLPDVNKRIAGQAQRGTYLERTELAAAYNSVDAMLRRAKSGSAISQEDLNVAIIQAHRLTSDPTFAAYAELPTRLEALRGSANLGRDLTALKANYFDGTDKAFKATQDGAIESIINRRVSAADGTVIKEDAEKDYTNGDIATNIAEPEKNRIILAGLAGTITKGDDKLVQTWAGAVKALHEGNDQYADEVRYLSGSIAAVRNNAPPAGASAEELAAHARALQAIGEADAKIAGTVSWGSGASRGTATFTNVESFLNEYVNAPTRAARSALLQYASRKNALQSVFMDRPVAQSPSSIKVMRFQSSSNPGSPVTAPTNP